MTDLARTAKSTPNIFVASTAANYPDADSYLYSIYHSKAAGTWMSTEWLQNDEIDKLIEMERKQLDASKRNKLLNEIQMKISELYPDIFINCMPLKVGII